MPRVPTERESREAALAGLCAPLTSVISTADLRRRPNRPPDHRVENEGLIALSGALSGTPRNVLQRLVVAALGIRGAHSSGISLLTSDARRFYWPAVAGKWAAYAGGGTPREHGPCGTVLDLDSEVLFTEPQRHFTYLSGCAPAIHEALLVPFHVEGRAVGTVWVVSHTRGGQFDSEDLRVLITLAAFAGAAYQILQLKDRLTPADLLGDVLDRERAARLEAEEALRSRDQAFLTATHNMRGPLNAVRGWASLLSDDFVPEAETSDALRAIANNAERLSVLVEKLLGAGRLQSERFQPHPNPVAQILEEALASAAPAARAKAIALHADAGVELWVMADFQAIHDAVSNLLLNAVKFTPDGGRIDVRCAPHGARVRIEVADSGIGIDPAFVPRLFQPFTQADTPLRREGVGLGLAIVKHIVEAHDGSVEAYSAGLGRGATFTVSLPVVTA